MLETVITPRQCICPTMNYTCVVTSGIEIGWLTNTTGEDLRHFATQANFAYKEKGGFQVTFIRQGHNLTSLLHVKNLDLNGTNLVCEGATLGMLNTERQNDSITMCVVGKFHTVV